MSAPLPGPPIRRRQLGVRLRAHRETAGMTMAPVMEVLGCGKTRVITIEGGTTTLAKAELSKLLDLFGLPPDSPERDELEALRADGKKRGWTSTAGLPKHMRQFADLETDAQTARSFEVETIPGLLQTESYARRTHELVPDLDPVQAGKWIQATLRRQLRLRESPLLTLDSVISESALQRLAAERELATAQLEHLLAMAKLPNVTLRILLQSSGLHVSMSGSFVLLDFDPAWSISAAYEESAAGGRLSDDRDVIIHLDKVFTDLKRAALGPEDSVRHLEKLREEVIAT